MKRAVSVCIMSYGYAHLIGHALESVITQTKKPDKIFAVDDGAHDFNNLVKKYPQVEFIIRSKNLGIVDNFNDMLFNQVKTDRALFLGADNWLEPTAIEKMSAHTEDIVSCDAWIWGKGKPEYWELPYQPHGSALYNVAKAREVGGYEASGGKKSEEDSVLFKRMLEAGASFKRVEEPLLFYRIHKYNFQK